MARARMLLVEDEPMLRRFVRLALEELPLEILECDSVADAINLLTANTVQLIVTDLMLPGASGVDLLRHLQTFPDLRGQAKVVVFSAGLTPATRLALAPLQVWRMLEKPVSIGILEQCVHDALADARAQTTPTPRAPPTATGTAVDQFFGGDAELFHLYRATCLVQFPHDLAAGDHAIDTRDTQALRRVAHSLKTVLLTIDLPQLAARAGALEQTCHAAQQDAAERDWEPLRAALAEFIKNQAFTHI
ncbi:MAG: response regulator [Ferruginibacter sp.]|nr:response regulator [Rhodoferax sp.]